MQIRTLATSWDGSRAALAPLLQPCVSVLGVQLDDLRSALVKEAAATIGVLALSLGPEAGVWTEQLLQPLLALSRNAKVCL